VKYFLEKGFRNLRAVDKKPLPMWYQQHHGVDSLCMDLSEKDNCIKAAENAVEIYQLAADMAGWVHRAFRIECLRSILINTHMIEAAYRRDASGIFIVRRHARTTSSCRSRRMCGR